MQAVSEVRTPTEEHVKRVELLLHENNVLTKQNTELDKEVAQLNADNEGLAKQLLAATQQYGEINVTLKQKDAEVMSMASACVHQLLQCDSFWCQLATIGGFLVTTCLCSASQVSSCENV
jgi:chromosome segregation ATPase